MKSEAAASVLGLQMEREIAEQPAVLASIVARRAELANELLSVQSMRPVGILLIARGSSMHAAQYWRYVIEISTGIPTMLAAVRLAM